jgi:hypothetical protein
VNRAKRPWIITMAHRPMYCSNADGDDCTKQYDLVRTGLPGIQAYGLEDLFFKYGVDLNIAAHEHSYERLWPVYNQEVFNGSRQFNPYDNPGAPVHITSGSAGCQVTFHFILLAFDRNFPCQTLKIRNVSLVVMGA